MLTHTIYPLPTINRLTYLLPLLLLFLQISFVTPQVPTRSKTSILQQQQPPPPNNTQPPNNPPPVSPTQQTAPPTPSKTDSACPDGVCKVDGRGTCVSMGASRTCSAFKDSYLPTNLKSYFSDRFRLKNTDLVPPFTDIKNVTMFDNTFTNREKFEINYDWMNKYMIQYMVQMAGCSIPTQQWYQTWFCMDILKFFMDQGNPCSTGAPPKICASTIDDRLNSVVRDTSNITTCPYTQKVPSSNQIAQTYITQLRTHPWRDTSINCISGIANEEQPSGEKKCGMFAFQACLRKDLCPQVSAQGVPNFCDRELNQPPKTAKLVDSLDKEPSKSGIFALIGMSTLAFLALFAGLATLNNIRTQGSKLEAGKEAERYVQQQQQNQQRHQVAPKHARTTVQVNAQVPLTSMMYAQPTGPQVLPVAMDPVLVSHEVTLPYQPQQPDELHLQLGDIVDVLSVFDDGWCCGRVRSTGVSGMCPMACFQLVQLPNGGYQNRYQSLGRR